ncbi:hypothetical protein [Corallococcus sp. CA054B]|uniref:hypothetical protein n=1 Tax=Corallococcus sp. CA054B TaxID=2316734 RepID=UPI0013150653|nr:hypothetical protein [Corallococcus sp. CA054B]
MLDTHTCAADIARKFLRKPTVRPDTSCAAASRIEFLVEPLAPAVPQPDEAP